MSRSRAPVARLALAAAGLAFVTLSPSRALAQPPPNEARADTLFNAAKQLRDGGQVADACPMFAESKRLSPAVGVTLYLADCYERLGRTASAWEQFRDAERLARERGDEKRAAVAHARAQALEAKLDRLTVVSQPGLHEGWQVLVDGAPLPADRWNAALAVDPGDHVVTVQAPGQLPRSLSAHVDVSTAAATVRIDDAAVASMPAPAAAGTPILAAAGTPAPASAGTPTPASAESGAAETVSPEAAYAGSSSARLWGGLALVGAGAVGVGFGTFFAVRKSELENGGCSNDASLADQAQTASTIAFAAGGVALVSALVVFVSAPSSKNQVGWAIAPVPLLGGAGATVRASF